MSIAVQREPRELVADVERRLGEVEELRDAAARETATELVQALLELYGAGLERIVAQVAAHDDGRLAAALADDELVAHLLLLHGLHPVALEDRVAEALAEVRPYLDSHGGDVQLLGIEGSAVHLRLQGSCSGCPSSTMTLKLAIENAIRKLAPEIEEVIADAAPAPPGPALLEIQMPAWTTVGTLRELAQGGPVVKQIAGAPILFLRVGERFYAYRPSCPACGESLAGAALEGGELRCGGCGNRYDARRAGRCLGSPGLHLQPVPLLRSDDGLVKVALGVPA